MVANPKADCLRRASWYLSRIDALQREMVRKPVLDGDDVEQCQAMLREIRARFRADQRTPPPGQTLSQIEVNFRATLAQANEVLRIAVGSRPAGRWRTLLSDCATRISHFSATCAAPIAEERPR